MSEPVKRFECNGNVYEEPEGEFVLFSDHERALAEKDAESDEWRKQAGRQLTGCAIMAKRAEKAEAVLEQERKHREDYTKFRKFFGVPEGGNIYDWATDLLKAKRENLGHLEIDLRVSRANEKYLLAELASLKARCEGMREVIEEIAKDRKGRTPAIYRAMARAAIINASLPVEGLAERVAGDNPYLLHGDELERAERATHNQ
jgi:flagellar motility protein MotE (MotC chaperone)